MRLKITVFEEQSMKSCALKTQHESCLQKTLLKTIFEFYTIHVTRVALCAML